MRVRFNGRTSLIIQYMYSIIKRCFDFLCALIALLVLLPVFLLTALGILVSDWRPIFYTAHRIGKGNKPFKMYKFRSMRVAKAANEASLRPDEDRIFPFGHFIRNAKIDELPQLINILNGTMSIIGPRPVAEDQFDMFRYGKWNEAAKELGVHHLQLTSHPGRVAANGLYRGLGFELVETNCYKMIL